MILRRIGALLSLCIFLCWPAIGCAASFYGRLYIPSAGVDVGLYQSSDRQAAVDREDSACIFRMRYGRRTRLIADHYTQAFGSLSEVAVGDIARIVTKDGESISLVCVEVYEGHNTGHGITDADKNNVIGQHDFLMYTCRGYWRNVYICQWDIVTDAAARDPPASRIIRTGETAKRGPNSRRKAKNEIFEKVSKFPAYMRP